MELWTKCGLVVSHNNPVRDIERKLLVNPEWFLVGEIDGDVMATCMAGYEGHRGWINYLAVRPDLQGHGYGKMILERAEDMLEAAGCPKINLQIRHTNQNVISFYENSGYRQDPVASMGKRLIPDNPFPAGQGGAFEPQRPSDGHWRWPQEQQDMTNAGIRYSDSRQLPLDSVVALYRANAWSSAEKPALLQKALFASHAVATAWDGPILVGLANAISDGHLVVYYPHLLVLPGYQGRGIGTALMRRLMERYQGFHQQILVADGRALDFYRKCGFERAGKTESMWIYAGHDH